MLRKVEALLDVRTNLQPALYADRLFKVQEDGSATRKVQLKHRDGNQKLAWDGSCGLRYVRKRTWRGLLTCAPKFDERAASQRSAAVGEQRGGSNGGSSGGSSGGGVGGGSNRRQSIVDFSVV